MQNSLETVHNPPIIASEVALCLGFITPHMQLWDDVCLLLHDSASLGAYLLSEPLPNWKVMQKLLNTWFTLPWSPISKGSLEQRRFTMTLSNTTPLRTCLFVGHLE